MAQTDKSVVSALSSFGRETFSERYKSAHPDIWAAIENQYGVGGKRSGNYRSAYTHIGFLLNTIAKKGELTKLDYGSAPEHWGSPVIRHWSNNTALQSEAGSLFPDEADERLIEGDKVPVLVNRYERNPKARLKCVEHYGLKCQGCHLDFGQMYGEHGSGFIHVHHLTPVSEQDDPYEVSPIEDLIPVCPNCHAMFTTENQCLRLKPSVWS